MEGHDAPTGRRRLSGWVVFGWIATAVYAALIAFVLFDPRVDGFLHITNNDLSLNTFGDFLAGACAPLAFLWLFVATMVQSQELALQREELRLTREEFRQNREVAKQQAEEARMQARFIGAQTAILQAAEIDKLIDTQMAGVLRRVNDIRGAAILVGKGGEQGSTYIGSPVSDAFVDFAEAAKGLISAARGLRSLKPGYPERTVQFTKPQQLQAIHQLLCVIDANVQNASQKTSAELKNADFAAALEASDYLATHCG
ncbi:hypothetical protein NLY43_24110 [Mesorhizobium sp. C416B]|uniref:hypothetical protein n=1 Tax=unclassified Mesorhizobium TaxID=325217 RepID=UPI0003CE0E4A|nr:MULTISPECIES: hypothetical protein [unclassified Mesorhizobium]ESX48813.1 hypothetical protein X762_10945 [Mesorhizobium sp. LSHC426A00]ESX55555.1 hypothetical protein X761_14060 [Mesorhizobium sp. LSHC424B00]ESX70290.1 hypothetical protein X758_16855 [Mesorhizobium sp. LSHC416B00]WJI61671.1 hypothetical protein NLY43_24110 [Mesorhizobium sp. C416B]